MRNIYIRWRWIFYIFIIFLLSFTPSSRYFELAKNLDIFATLYSELDAYYVDEINPNQIIESGIKAMLKELDPYTNYISEGRIEEFRTITTGAYGGIGASVGIVNEKIKILLPYEGYIAYKSGLEIGDEIIEVDGKNIQNKKITEITDILKGQINTKVIILVKRYGEKLPLRFELKREKIHIKNVPYYGMVTGDIGMIKLTDFTLNASKEVINKLKDLKIDGAKKIILDLRDNPGGLLDEAIKISNIFLPKNRILVTTRGRIPDWNTEHSTLNHPVDTEIPIVVLIDRYSASASEIVSGVIQDYDRGVIIGQRSFGKGLVQTTRPLPYNAKLKLTVAKYYIPSGRCIQEIDYSKKSIQDFSQPDDFNKATFYTKNKREVYGGGGITPDIEVKLQEYALITQELLSQGVLFDYATQYKYNHREREISFKMNKEEYKEFVQWLKNSRFKYTMKAESIIQDLMKRTDLELVENVQDELQKALKKIINSKEKELFVHQDEIKELIEQEIITRYHLQRGNLEATFDDNKSIQAAVQILNNMPQYNRILNKNS